MISCVYNLWSNDYFQLLYNCLIPSYNRALEEKMSVKKYSLSRFQRGHRGLCWKRKLPNITTWTGWMRLLLRVTWGFFPPPGVWRLCWFCWHSWRGRCCVQWFRLLSLSALRLSDFSCWLWRQNTLEVTLPQSRQKLTDWITGSHWESRPGYGHRVFIKHCLLEKTTLLNKIIRRKKILAKKNCQ